jgi:hypothetical protein
VVLLCGPPMHSGGRFLFHIRDIDEYLKMPLLCIQLKSLMRYMSEYTGAIWCAHIPNLISFFIKHYLLEPQSMDSCEQPQMNVFHTDICRLKKCFFFILNFLTISAKSGGN